MLPRRRRRGRVVLRELVEAQYRTTVVMDGHDAPSPQATNLSPSAPGAAEARIFFTPGVSYARADWLDDPTGLSPWELANPSHSVLLHELLHARGTVLGLRDFTTVEADDGVPSDTGRVAREEHRVVGLGKYASDPLTQARYIQERNAIAREGFGATPSDTVLASRASYWVAERRPMGAARDPVYADLFVAMTLDGKPAMPAHACAWAQRNSGMVSTAVFVAAVKRATDTRYATEVELALEQPREVALQAYIDWRSASR
ncbi:MAG: hypothetical protein ACAI38_18380 [Myxococcota bacterium]